MDAKTLSKLAAINANKHPEIRVGDKVKLYMKIKEGNKERTQLFEGFIIATRGRQLDKTITVRKISSGVGVERVIPLNSPTVEKIEIVKKGNVRKSKLYYMRDRIGKASMKVRGKDAEIEKELAVAVEDVAEETATEDSAEVKAEAEATEEAK